MKFDYTKPWNELSTEEKTAFDKKCGKSVMKGVSDFADRFNVEIGNCADLMTWNGEAEWNAKHKTAVRKALVAQAKTDLKTCKTVEEAEAVKKTLALKLENVGF